MPYVAAGAFLISFSSIFVKIADVGPTAAMFYRFLIGGLTLTCAAVVMKDSLWKGPGAVAWAAAGGIVFSFDLFLWHRSIHYAGPGVATILANFQVFGLAFVGVVFMGERLGLRRLVSIPLSLLGLLMLVGPDWNEPGAQYRIGVVYGLGTAVLYTALTVVLRKSQTMPDMPSPTAHMAWVGLFGALAAGVEVKLIGETFDVPNMHSLIALFGYGAVCSGLGWSLIATGLPKMDASRAGLILILQPALAYTWEILLFTREATAVSVIGAVIALTAIFLGSTAGLVDERPSNSG